MPQDPMDFLKQQERLFKLTRPSELLDTARQIQKLIPPNPLLIRQQQMKALMQSPAQQLAQAMQHRQDALQKLVLQSTGSIWSSAIGLAPVKASSAMPKSYGPTNAHSVMADLMASQATARMVTTAAMASRVSLPKHFQATEIFGVESYWKRQQEVFERMHRFSLQRLQEQFAKSWEADLKLESEVLPVLQAHAEQSGWSLGVIYGNLTNDLILEIMRLFKEKDFEGMDAIYMFLLDRALPELTEITRHVLGHLLEPDDSTDYIEEFLDCVANYQQGARYRLTVRNPLVALEGIYYQAAIKAGVLDPNVDTKSDIFYSKSQQAKPAQLKIEQALAGTKPFSGFLTLNSTAEGDLIELAQKARDHMRSSIKATEKVRYQTRHQLAHGAPISNSKALAARSLLFFIDQLMILGGAFAVPPLPTEGLET